MNYTEETCNNCDNYTEETCNTGRINFIRLKLVSGRKFYSE